MKKRVMCVFDGQRRLWKDDLLLDSTHEVRIPLQTDPNSEAAGGYQPSRWVTDLDVLTMRRAEGILGATEEEKGPWVDENGVAIDINQLVNG